MHPYLVVAEMLKEYGPEEGLRRFANSETLAAVERFPLTTLPRCAASSRGPINRARSNSFHASRWMGPVSPCTTWPQFDMPTLVIGNGEDYVHPLQYACD